MNPELGERVTTLLRGEFFAGTVTKLMPFGFVWRQDRKTAAIVFTHDEGVTWIRGAATLADRYAMTAAVALRNGA